MRFADCQAFSCVHGTHPSADLGKPLAIKSGVLGQARCAQCQHDVSTYRKRDPFRWFVTPYANHSHLFYSYTKGHTLGNLFEICVSPTHPQFKTPLIVTFLPMPLYSFQCLKILRIARYVAASELCYARPSNEGKVGILFFFGPMMSCQQCRSRTGRCRSLRGCGGQAMRLLRCETPLLPIVSGIVVTFRLTPAFWLGTARRVDLS